MILGNASENLLRGYAGNDYLDGGGGADSMIGGTGDDSYVVASEGDAVFENAAEGHDSVLSSLSYALGTNLEDLYLNGFEDINGSGNELDNRIEGNSGENILSGLSGNDEIRSGDGDDRVTGGEGDDLLDGEYGTDVIDGGAGNDRIFGGANADRLIGGAGDDTLDDGLDGSTDYLEGGFGNDLYLIDRYQDRIVEHENEGHDRVRILRDSFVLPGNVEDLFIVDDFSDGGSLGSILNGIGNDLANQIVGHEGADALHGEGGDDEVDGRGGDDTILGGEGDDRIEGGDDAVFIRDYKKGGEAPSVAHIEILSSNHDVIQDLSGNNNLDGGSGNDRLMGGDGDDFLYGGKDGAVIAGDQFYLRGDGALTAAKGDFFRADLSLYFAGSLLEGGFFDLHPESGEFFVPGVERPIGVIDIESDGRRIWLGNDDILDSGGGNDLLDGGSGNDWLYGGDGRDWLYGGDDGSLNATNDDYLDGGAGVDTLIGGAGDDTYIVDGMVAYRQIIAYDECGDAYDSFERVVTADTVIEQVGQGLDAVYASVDFKLSAEIEDLFLEPLSGEALRGVGNALDNRIEGNNFDNWLDGDAGDDVLIGGLGNDTYVMDSENDLIVEGEDLYGVVWGGMDTIAAQYSISLDGDPTRFAFIENLQLLGNADVDATGSGADNLVSGNEGDNVLSGLDGNDVLQGGRGDDVLLGGSGSDHYIFWGGDGSDTIQDSQGEGNFVSILGGAHVQDMIVERSGYDMRILFKQGIQDCIVLSGWFSGQTRIDHVEFCDGEMLDATQLKNMIAFNAGPIAEDDNAIVIEDTDPDARGNVLVNDSDLEGDVLSLLEAGQYQGSFGALVLEQDGAYVYLLDDNSSQWLAEGEIVQDIFYYTARDSFGGLSTAALAIEIDGRNDAPVAYNDTGAAIEDGGPLTLSISVLLDNDTDVDAGDTKTLGYVTNSSAGARVGIAGTDVVYDVGTLYQSLPQDALATDSFIYTMVDAAGATSEATVVVTITGVNDAPTAIIDMASVREDDLPNATGNVLSNDGDVDQDTVLSVARPFSATGTYGTLTLSEDGNYVYALANGSTAVQALRGGQVVTDTFSYVATDSWADSTSTLTIDIAGTNDAPIVDSPIPDQSVFTSNAFHFTFNAHAFTDFDTGDALSFTATLASGNALPSWLAFNPATRTFTGTPSSADAGSVQLRVNATDQAGASAFDVFLLIVAAAGGKTIIGTDCDDNLVGTDLEDVIDGREGADSMAGKRGDDKYYVDNSCDVVKELLGQGSDLVFSSVTYTLPSNVENITLTGTKDISATGNALDNILVGNNGRNTLSAGSGNDVLDGRGGSDSMSGGAGNDVYFIDSSADSISESTNQGNDTVQSIVSFGLGANVENLLLIGSASINGKGNTSANLLMGNSATNTLSGSGGNDIIQGLGGDDTLNASGARTLIDGGAGADVISGGSGNDMFIGGLGNDTISTGAGADILAFNAGCGQDLVNASIGADNVLSLGGGIRYEDLKLTKSGTNLILKTGATDQFTFKDWYLGTGPRSAAKLQIFTEAMPEYDQNSANVLFNHKVEQFNFSALVNAFDAAGQVNGWALTNALLSAHLSGSDTAAIGGDLAYQYGRTGSLSGIGLTPAQDVINAAQFGNNAQSLRTLPELQQGQIRLS